MHDYEITQMGPSVDKLHTTPSCSVISNLEPGMNNL